MALAFTMAWIALGRVVTPRALAAGLTIAVASGASAAVALLAARLLARRGWSARFAAASLMLISGTAVLTAGLIGAHTAWTTHPLLELSPKLVLIIVALSSVGSLYSFLAIAGFLILPLGVPLIFLAAALVANQPPRLGRVA